MNDDAVRRFSFGAPVRSVRSSLLWLATLVAVGAWTGDFDLFWIALISGTSLDFLLRWTPWKGRITARLLAFFGPIILVVVLAVFFDDRAWLKPLWILISLFFGGMIIGSIGGAEVRKDALTLRSFAVSKLRIPYDKIESIEVACELGGGATRVRLSFKDLSSATQRQQFLQFADGDAREFVAELERRAGLA